MNLPPLARIGKLRRPPKTLDDVAAELPDEWKADTPAESLAMLDAAAAKLEADQAKLWGRRRRLDAELLALADRLNTVNRSRDRLRRAPTEIVA